MSFFRRLSRHSNNIAMGRTCDTHSIFTPFIILVKMRRPHRPHRPKRFVFKCLPKFHCRPLPSVTVRPQLIEIKLLRTGRGHRYGRNGPHPSLASAPRPRRYPPVSIIVATVEGERATGGRGVGTVESSGTDDAGNGTRTMPSRVRPNTGAQLLDFTIAPHARAKPRGHDPRAGCRASGVGRHCSGGAAQEPGD